MKLHCPSCSSLIPAVNVELAAGWAKCAVCHDLFPLAGLLPDPIEGVQHARSYQPVCQSEKAATFGAELVYEKGSCLLPVDSKQEGDWLIFEVNDYLRCHFPEKAWINRPSCGR